MMKFKSMALVAAVLMGFVGASFAATEAEPAKPQVKTSKEDKAAARAKRTADGKAAAKSGENGTKSEASAMPAASSTGKGATAADRKAARAKRNAEMKDAVKKGDTPKATP